MAKDASFFGLNRPEYIPSRELFMSELAWSLTTEGSPRRIDPDYGPAGIAYDDRGTRNNSGLATTRPESTDLRFRMISTVLRERLGLQNDEEAQIATSVLLGELEAPASAGATRSVATPVTIEAALLQDRRGVTGKNNPANIALILETMYALGNGNGSVSGKWAQVLFDAGQSGLPIWARDAITEIVPTSFRDSVQQLAHNIETAEPQESRRPAWLVQCHSTPFHWFAASWNRLCTDGWIEKMPRRRWTDWAACVARTAIAMGYMFEMHLTRRMTASLVSSEDPDVAVRSTLDQSNRLFAWDDRLELTAADVGPTMNRLAAVGTECLSLLADLVEPESGDEGIPMPSEYDQDDNGLSRWLVRAREVITKDIVKVREQVSEALDARRTGRANNTWETMRYSLLDRSEVGTSDLYALLRRAGRYTSVEPGQEWLVTIASLQASGPGQLSRLTDLQEALSAIGIEASQQTLISRLEGFGLARSSHDADSALEIMAGF